LCAAGNTQTFSQSPAVPKYFELIFMDGSDGLNDTYRHLKKVFRFCAPGGMVVFRGWDGLAPRLPGQYCPSLQGFWERLPLRFPGFQYLKAPVGIEVGLAWRCQ